MEKSVMRVNAGNRKLNNKGSALVSVLVVTAFITIIGTTMLYISAQNYQMKQTDYQNKQSFYEAEKAIDSLKALLVKDVQDAYLIAYNDTMNNYLKLGNATDRKEYFQKRYHEELKKLWDARVPAATGDADADAAARVTALKNYMISGGLAAEADCIYRFDGYDVSPTTTTDPSTGTITTKERFVLLGVRAKFTSGSYTNFLCTDICLELPELELDESMADGKLISMTDCVIYMNWHKTDYYD